MVGKLVATLPGVEHGDLHYRLIEIDKIEALQNTDSDYKAGQQKMNRLGGQSMLNIPESFFLWPSSLWSSNQMQAIRVGVA